ncbi:hypothetical protein Fcan01_15184 [Folsomia candida]|uniref:Uncharacterized protein n=1 Tax=Folsomia candida TaxID=158441 RepID=A0A226DYS8_FOLCA|nr:hypothetical protein Fcan01_15184 [Folsomia candida]
MERKHHTDHERGRKSETHGHATDQHHRGSHDQGGRRNSHPPPREQQHRRESHGHDRRDSHDHDYDRRQSHDHDHDRRDSHDHDHDHHYHNNNEDDLGEEHDYRSLRKKDSKGYIEEREYYERRRSDQKDAAHPNPNMMMANVPLPLRHEDDVRDNHGNPIVNVHVPIPPPPAQLGPLPQLQPIQPIETDYPGHHHERWYFFWPPGGQPPPESAAGAMPPPGVGQLPPTGVPQLPPGSFPAAAPPLSLPVAQIPPGGQFPLGNLPMQYQPQQPYVAPPAAGREDELGVRPSTAVQNLPQGVAVAPIVQQTPQPKPPPPPPPQQDPNALWARQSTAMSHLPSSPQRPAAYHPQIQHRPSIPTSPPPRTVKPVAQQTRPYVEKLESINEMDENTQTSNVLFSPTAEPSRVGGLVVLGHGGHGRGRYVQNYNIRDEAATLPDILNKRDMQLQFRDVLENQPRYKDAELSPIFIDNGNQPPPLLRRSSPEIVIPPPKKPNPDKSASSFNNNNPSTILPTEEPQQKGRSMEKRVTKPNTKKKSSLADICPNCGIGYFRTRLTTAAYLSAILLFPIGTLACLARKCCTAEACTYCGHYGPNESRL